MHGQRALGVPVSSGGSDESSGSEMFDPDQAVAYTLGMIVIAFVTWVLAR
jgi:hypothetical protein